MTSDRIRNSASQTPEISPTVSIHGSCPLGGDSRLVSCGRHSNCQIIRCCCWVDVDCSNADKSTLCSFFVLFLYDIHVHLVEHRLMRAVLVACRTKNARQVEVTASDLERGLMRLVPWYRLTLLGLLCSLCRHYVSLATTSTMLWNGSSSSCEADMWSRDLTGHYHVTRHVHTILCLSLTSCGLQRSQLLTEYGAI